ncbi:hypothetical protein OAG56_06415, partial [Mariniblastus sp.]
REFAIGRPRNAQTEINLFVLNRFSTKEDIIGKKQNTFAKIQRDRQKKQKAEDKRIRRLERKNDKANIMSVPDPEDANGEDDATKVRESVDGNQHSDDNT